jgi:hypothetical protein
MDRIKAAYKPSFSQSGTGDQKNETVTSPTHLKVLNFLKVKLEIIFIQTSFPGQEELNAKSILLLKKMEVFFQ